jgi:hypothetical protein
LLSGGMPYPGALDSDQKNLPSTLSKAAARQRPALELVRDLEGGPAVVKSKEQTYLPKAPGESFANYANRLARATFFNFFGRTAKGLVGFIFRKAPVLGEDVPKKIVEHWENIDNAGTHGDVFARELEQDAMVAGHNAILVEFPATEGQQSFADEKQEIRPYWIPIKKDNIVSWRVTAEKGRTILTQVALRECTMVPDGAYGEKEQTRFRVLYRENGVVGWRLEEISEDKKVIVVAKGLYGNQTEIPLSENVTSGRKSMFESDPPLEDLAHLNLAHYRQWSDYDTGIHKTNVPIWVTIGEQIDPDNAGKTQVLGASTGLALPLGADAKYVSHDGAALASAKAALDDLKSDIASFGLAMLASQKRAAETAEAKRIDKSGTDSQLAVSARGLQDCLERALQFHANYLKEKDGGSVEICQEYEEVLMESDVMTAYANLVAEGFDKEIAVRMLQQGGRVPEDADPETVAMEWDAAAKAADEAKRLEMEQEADDMARDAKKMDPKKKMGDDMDKAA